MSARRSAVGVRFALRVARGGVEEVMGPGGRRVGGRLERAGELLARLHPRVAHHLDLGVGELALRRPPHARRRVAGGIGDDMDLEPVGHVCRSYPPVRHPGSWPKSPSRRSAAATFATSVSRFARTASAGAITSTSSKNAFTVGARAAAASSVAGGAAIPAA